MSVNENFGSGRKGTAKEKNKCVDRVARAAEVQTGRHRNNSWQNTRCWGDDYVPKSITFLPRVLIVNLLTYGQISIGDRKPCQGKWIKSGKMQIAFGNRKNMQSQRVVLYSETVEKPVLEASFIPLAF